MLAGRTFGPVVVLVLFFGVAVLVFIEGRISGMVIVVLPFIGEILCRITPSGDANRSCEPETTLIIFPERSWT